MGLFSINRIWRWKILFDTGFRENTVLENAESLRVDLSAVEHVFRSHNHLDHTGGLIRLRETLMSINPKAMQYVHVGKGIFLERVSDGKNWNTFMGYKEKLLSLGVEFIYHESREEILPNICTSGLVPRYQIEKNWLGFREMKINGESFLRYPRVHRGMPKTSKVSLRCNF